MEQKHCTLKDVIREVNKKRPLKKIGYGIFCHPFLPTEGDKGFEGCVLVHVSKAEFLRCAQHALERLSERGAKINLRIPTSDYGSFSF